MTDAICPYCRCAIDVTKEPRVFCSGCGTPHHKACYEENGGCTVFGCSYAPADAPKVNVSATEVHSQATPQASPSGGVYPQPQPGGAQSARPQAPQQPYQGNPGYQQPVNYSQPQPGGYYQQQYPGNPGYQQPINYSQPQPGGGYYQQQYPGNPGFQQPQPGGYYQQPMQQPALPYGYTPKSRVAFILLGLFLGGFGIHNFYAGYTGKAVAQLLITLLIGWLIVPLFAVGIWVIIEVCTVSTDSNGIKFKD